MANITIDYADKRHHKGSIKLNKFAKQFPGKLQKAFKNIGIVLTGKVKRNLSGESHTKYPGTSNPYPGVITGRLRASVNFRTYGGASANRMGVEIGPNTNYAESVNYLYPYMVPAYYDSEDKIAVILKDFLRGATR